MRAQIRGLEQAEQNVLNGISFVQTADGGLAEIQNPNLVRLRELAIQAANDTLTDEDRLLIQREVNQIVKGIDDIANYTEFNSIYPLRHSVVEGKEEISGNGGFLANKYLSLTVNSKGEMDLRTNKGYPNTVDDDNKILIYGGGRTSNPSLILNGQGIELKKNILNPTVLNGDAFETRYSIGGIEVLQKVRLHEDKFEFIYEIKNTKSTVENVGFYFHMDTMLGNDDHAPFMVDNSVIEKEIAYRDAAIPEKFDIFNNKGNSNLKAEGKLTGDGILLPPDEFRIGKYDLIDKINWTNNNNSVGDSAYALMWNERSLQPGESLIVNSFYGISVPPNMEESKWTPSTLDPEFLILQVGANEGQHLKVHLTDARAVSLGIGNLNLSAQEQANNALGIIDSATSYISRERSKYGAIQNALEHISGYLGNARENLTSSESGLRDADMSNEMANLTKYQVLLQSSQTMMAQVNQMSQGILEILK